ncbi:hypothetical protein HDF26_001600 [Pedobacter cryoconitis]|uniref:hypothetical protein n=1 Tax=Pedobacter cryoconitis TaxID=188932 RepID=UPI00161579EF|nr:hypothetical protein [Pedobacter cryoconitis]MBB6271173.1 hypothetical protein [Pedobacter cryoconitis]
MAFNFLASGCSDGGQKIAVYPKMGIGEKIYLNTVTIDGEYKKKDSALVLENGKEIVFHIYCAEQQIYALSSSFNNFTVFFINDHGSKTIHADFFARTYQVNGSPATNSLIQFQRKQADMLKIIGQLIKRKDSIGAARLRQQYNQNYINYADTVRNPVSFAIVNDKVDFGTDHEGLKRYINRANRKFKGHSQFDWIYMNALGYLKKVEVTGK